MTELPLLLAVFDGTAIDGLALPFAFLGTTELLIVLGIAVLLFGSRKLPELARAMGSSVTQFRKGLDTEDKDKPEDDEKSLPGN